jgi:hypothetical protein
VFEEIVVKSRLGAAVFVVISLAGGPLHAASESLPWSDGGAGPSDFAVSTDSFCSSSGISFRDNVDYGFDGASLVKVNGTGVGASATTVDVSSIGSDSIATYSETVGDLLVEVSYRFTDDNLARTLVTITNQGATAASALPIALLYDHGDTFTIRSVSGGTWRNSGNSFVMSEAGVATGVFDNYKAVFHLPDGPGSPESMASVVTCLGASVNVGDSVEYVQYTYSLDIPAGESRRVLTFHGMDQTADGVTVKSQTLSQSLPSPGSGLLSDLSVEDACTVVNWAFEVCGSDGGSEGSFDFDDIDIDHYRQPTELPDTV